MPFTRHWETASNRMNHGKQYIASLLRLVEINRIIQCDPNSRKSGQRRKESSGFFSPKVQERGKMQMQEKKLDHQKSTQWLVGLFPKVFFFNISYTFQLFSVCYNTLIHNNDDNKMNSREVIQKIETEIAFLSTTFSLLIFFSFSPSNFVEYSLRIQSIVCTAILW